MVNNLLARFYFSNFWVFHSALMYILYILLDNGLTFLQGAHFKFMKELITEDLSCAQLRWIDQTLRNTSNSSLKLSESLEIHCNKMTQWRLNEDLSIRREKLSQLKNRWFVVIKDGAFETIEDIFDNSVLSSRSCQLLISIISYCNVLWLRFFSCIIKRGGDCRF